MIITGQSDLKQHWNKNQLWWFIFIKSATFIPHNQRSLHFV